MATWLEQWSKNGVCAVIWFLNARNVLKPQIHCQLVEVYGEDVKESAEYIEVGCGILRPKSQHGGGEIVKA
jgi:hypothetical protein